MKHYIIKSAPKGISSNEVVTIKEFYAECETDAWLTFHHYLKDRLNRGGHIVWVTHQWNYTFDSGECLYMFESSK